MKKSIIFSLLIILISLNICFAQKLVSPNIIGENHTIHSKLLEGGIDISIYVPDSYQDSKRKYPVLYIIDGQRYFLNGVLYQKTLKWQEKSPDFIVVGINTDDRRRKLFYEQSKTFIQFLEQELTSYIDLNYRTSSERLFFGWEMAGGLAIEILAQPQSIFTAYFIASPTHINTARLDSLRERLIVKKNADEFIYFTLSPLESWSMPSLEDLSKILKESGREKLIWEYQSLDGENHHSTPTKTIHEGLSKYFSDYAYLRFYSLQEFDDFGGMSALKTHYQQRGERYNLTTEIHKDTKHFLILQSMKEDNFKSFEFFMSAFDDYYKSKNRDLWFNRYAQFYLKHQNSDKALEILNTGLNKFPNSSLILSGLGDSYLIKEETHQAKSYYKKAIELAIKNEDPNLEEYRSKLKQI